MFAQVVLALAATGAVYDLEWRDKGSSSVGVLTATIDTTTDTLTWNSIPEVDWWPTAEAVWPAMTNGGIDPYWGDSSHLLTIPYDIPDDWDGTLDQWCFLAPVVQGDWDNKTEPGIGCKKSTDFNRSRLYFGHRDIDWTIGGLYGVENHPADSPAHAFVDVLPISGGRLRGDANLDGRFDSGDIVQVFVFGKYGTEDRARWSEGDWNSDGLFNSSDVVTAFAAGGYDRPTAAVAVPEPSSWLILIACSGLMLRCCRIRRELAIPIVVGQRFF